MPSSGPRVRGWRFTLWPKHLTTEHSTLNDWFSWATAAQPIEGVRYLIMQHEIAPTPLPGSDGHHIQGYVHFACAKCARPAQAVLKLQSNAFQTCQGTAADNRGYCSDPDKRQPGTVCFTYGDCPQGAGERNDLKRTWELVLKHDSLDQALDHEAVTTLKFHRHLEWGLNRMKKRRLRNLSREVFVIVYQGTPGAGKSELARLFDPDDCFSLPPPKAQNDLWFGDYDGERTLIIDEFEKQPKATLSLYWIKKILDGQPLQVPVKGGHRWAEWTFVVVTTNHHPTVWFNDADDFWQEFYHGNNFGAEFPSALQRRIDITYTFEGVWPNATIAPEYPLTLAALSIPPPEDNGANVAPEATVGEPSTEPAPSNPLPPSPQLDEEDTVLEDFVAQDNDFLRGIELLPEQADPDGLFDGTDGDREPLYAEDLMGDADLW